MTTYLGRLLRFFRANCIFWVMLFETTAKQNKLRRIHAFEQSESNFMQFILSSICRTRWTPHWRCSEYGEERPLTSIKGRSSSSVLKQICTTNVTNQRNPQAYIITENGNTFESLVALRTLYAASLPVDRNVSLTEWLMDMSNSRNMLSRRLVRKSATYNNIDSLLNRSARCQGNKKLTLM